MQSQRMRHLAPSPTLAMSAQATALQARGRPIMNLSVGEPDFPTPAFICDAAKQALDQGDTRYTAVPGTVTLRKAIQEKFSRDHRLLYTLDQIVVGCGVKPLIFNAFLATLDPGDEVLIPTPYWVSYPDMVRFSEGVPCFVPCHEHNLFKLQPQDLEAAITPKTKWLILNTPNNPSGAVLGEEDLRALGEVLKRFPHVHILSDDIYEKLMYTDRPFVTLAQAVPELQERTLIFNGLSKAYAMTGWRVGYAAGPAPLIKDITAILSQSTTCVNAMALAASVVALQGDQSFLKEWCKVFKARRDFLVQALQRIEGIHCTLPEGAFYVFPSVKNLIGEGRRWETDTDLAAYLLEEAGVATVPGSAFGAPGYLRLSYATSHETLEKACAALQRSLQSTQSTSTVGREIHP